MFTIGLLNKSIKIIEINKDNKINFAETISNDFRLDNLCAQNKLSESNIDEAAESINTVLKKSDTNAGISKILLDTNHCFVNVIPLDLDDSNDKINSNILWELSNYFPDNYKNYKISYHKLSTDCFSNNIKETLIIGIRFDIIEAVKKLAKRIDIKTSAIDIEHFASEKYYRYMRKSLPDKGVFIIIGCKKNRIDFSIIKEDLCIGYDYFFTDESNLQEKLSSIYLKFEEKHKETKFNYIYLYGDDTTSNAYKTINEIAKNVRLTLSNPFYELGITDSVGSEIISEGYGFVPLCGSALNQNI
jgi:Tfp pilus assembly PilM family ATPase